MKRSARWKPTPDLPDSPNLESWSRIFQTAGICVIVALLPGSYAVAQSTPPRDSSHYARGAVLARSGHYAQALPELVKAAQQDPRNPKVHNLIGIVLSQLGRLKEANEAYNRALALAPDFYPARKNRASNAFFEKEFKFAATEFEDLARLQPKDFVPQLFLGLVAIEGADFQKARAHLLLARQLAPREAGVLLALTRVFLTLGERQPAMETARDMRRTSNAKPGERFELGVVLAGFGADAEAADVFQELWQQRPGAYDVGFNLALLRYRSGQPEAALRTVEQLVAGGAQQAELWNLRGWLYHHTGHPDLAISSLERAVTMEPIRVENYLDLSTVLLDVSDPENARRVIAQGIEKCVEQDRLYVQMGVLETQNNNAGQAEAWYRRALEANPTNEAAYIALAHLLLVSEHEREAFTLLENALERLPSSVLLNYFYGALMMETTGPEDAARLAKARVILEKALALNPLFANTHYRLARILLAEGKEEQAMPHLEKACMLNPKHTKALYQLSQVLARRGQTERAAELSRALRQLLTEKSGVMQEEFSDLVRESLRRATATELLSKPAN